MCGSDYLDPTGFYQGADKKISGFYNSLMQTPDPPAPLPPPRLPTKSAEKIYGAKKTDDDEPQLLGTNALQIPLKTIQ